MANIQQAFLCHGHETQQQLIDLALRHRCYQIICANPTERLKELCQQSSIQLLTTELDPKSMELPNGASLVVSIDPAECLQLQSSIEALNIPCIIPK